jgi:hypothetical protein
MNYSIAVAVAATLAAALITFAQPRLRTLAARSKRAS